ncbi:MAG: type II 3-dehydroquinate dehydratase [Candidatus Sumerlaeia bacterium]|nr:type II 3-dehydroquinate dehydratase [Candidatus Sumerlaeia bacterium]
MPATSNKTLIAVVNGPNLNLLGTREPEVYGSDTLESTNARLEEVAAELGVGLTTFQSNHEGEIVDYLHGLRQSHHAVIVNPGGLTHTSVVLRDALASIALPVWEVHISNVHRREEFRHRSYISAIAEGVVCGLGIFGYEAALRAAVRHLKR